MNIEQLKAKYLGDSLASKEANKEFHEAKKYDAGHAKKYIKKDAWEKEINSKLKCCDVRLQGSSPVIRIVNFPVSNLTPTEASLLAKNLMLAAKYCQTQKAPLKK